MTHIANETRDHREIHGRDYSDPASWPYDPVEHRPAPDTGRGVFVLASIVIAAVIGGGFLYAGFLASNIVPSPAAISALSNADSGYGQDEMATGSTRR